MNFPGSRRYETAGLMGVHALRGILATGLHEEDAQLTVSVQLRTTTNDEDEEEDEREDATANVLVSTSVERRRKKEVKDNIMNDDDF
jgi:hypothetical protein